MVQPSCRRRLHWGTFAGNVEEASDGARLAGLVVGVLVKSGGGVSGGDFEEAGSRFGLAGAVAGKLVE